MRHIIINMIIIHLFCREPGQKLAPKLRAQRQRQNYSKRLSANWAPHPVLLKVGFGFQRAQSAPGQGGFAEAISPLKASGSSSLEVPLQRGLILDGRNRYQSVRYKSPPVAASTSAFAETSRRRDTQFREFYLGRKAGWRLRSSMRAPSMKFEEVR